MKPWEIARLLRQEAEAQHGQYDTADEQPTPNINTGVVYGGQSVTNTIVTGDYIGGNKIGKKNKKKGR
ncbi:hypothetical protein ABZ714_34025 [Streptomyces sp. NPDC006798]|uniref:hypothetical protein n=1 Tax=Streptomyces sp. NPDC006798 TaxID=3155462 RepID=UPI0033FD3AA1